MLRKLVVALGAVACLGGLSCVEFFALAQMPQATPQPPVAQRPSVEAFATANSIVSAAISPSGRYIAFVRQTGKVNGFDTDELVLIERATMTPKVLARAREEAGVQLRWVGWKSDDRILLGTSNRVTLEGES